jgi:DNA-binding XRE family transcriptional regulator
MSNIDPSLIWILLHRRTSGYRNAVGKAAKLDAEVRVLAQRLGANISRLRAERGITQEELADEADIAHRTARGIENAHYTPSFRLLARLTRALKVDVEELLRPTVFRRRAAGRPKTK